MENNEKISDLEEERGDKVIPYVSELEHVRATKPVSLYVQSSILEELDRDVWTKKVPERKKNKALYVISTINSIFWSNPKKFESRIQFVPVSSSVLRKVIGYDYSEIVQFLINLHIIERNDSYRVSTASRRGCCKGFRINPYFSLSQCEEVPLIGPDTFYLRVENGMEAAKTMRLESESHELIRRNTFNLLLSDPDEVISVLDGLDKRDEVVQAQKHFVWQLSQKGRDTGRNGSFFKVDDFGRVYSAFTNLFREARPFMSLDGEPLSCVDVHASHWFHTLMIWNERDSKDFDLLLNYLTTGDFYQFLADEIGWASRDDAKLPSLKFIHSHPERISGDVKKISEIVKEIAPEFWNWMRNEKLRKGAGGYKGFSRKLLREESNRVVVDVVQKLLEIDSSYPVVSLHDALYSPTARAEEVLSNFELVYSEVYGLVPRLAIEESDKKILEFDANYFLQEEERATHAA